VNDKDPWFKWYPTLTRKSFYWGLYGGFFLLTCVGVIIYLVIEIDPSEVDSACFDSLPLSDVVWSILLLGFAIYYTWRIYRTSDAYSIRSELKVFLFLFPIGFISTVIVNLFPQTQDIAVFILLFCTLAVYGVSMFYPIYLSYQPEWNRPRSLNSDNSNLPSDPFLLCLEHPVLLEAFKKFSVELWCSENIQFYLEVQNFKKSIEEGNASAKAEEIVATFIRSDSPLLINVDDAIPRDIISKVKEGSFGIDLFDQAEKAVLVQMKQDTFSKFNNSGRFKKACKEAGLDSEELFNEYNKSKKGENLSPEAVELLKSPNGQSHDQGRPSISES